MTINAYPHTAGRSGKKCGACDMNSPEQCAIDYYRAALEQRKPTWVPSRVRLPEPVRGDYPIGHNSVAEAGDHDCNSNRWGAVSVRATNGQMLGVKPAEFEPLAWRENT